MALFLFMWFMEFNREKESYIPSELQFSSSKLFFQHQNQMLQKIWFVSPMTIDIHYKYTFQEIRSDYFVEWGEFEWLTVDHDVHEQWIIYKVWFLNPRFKWVKNLSIDLKRNFVDNVSIRPLVRGFLWWCVVFAILFWLYNLFKLWKVLFWLNVIWVSILFLFYAWKFVSFFYKKSKINKVDYWGLKISYNNQSDALMLSSEMMDVLKKISKDFWIIKFCYTGNCVYLLQDIHDRNGDRLVSVSKLYSEQEKANLQQRTLEFIHNSEFLSHFISD